MKIAILMNDNSYTGREYLSNLKDFKIDVINIGTHIESDIQEDKRCGNFWKPERKESLLNFFTFFYFDSLKSMQLIEFLKDKNYDIGIQGGTGIIGNNIINKFNFGIINFHPGDLPEYRGCSAPEWQFFENKKIISTAHFIDEGIDTGKIILKKELKVSTKSYSSFRASIYPLTSDFVKYLLTSIIENKKLLHDAYIQNNSIAKYRKYIGEEKITVLKNKFKNGI